jgi:UDP-N-acetylmuramate--alanine ligase
MHFIGIGGIGMSGIAEILNNIGYEVSGSDLRPSEQTKRLESLGVKVFIGHSASNILDYNVVITSSAIDTNNPEIIEARKRKIPIIHRSEMLAELVRLKHGIGIAGTHGKTTTSSMLASVLSDGGMNPTAMIGGKVFNFGSNARVGQGEYIVFEADESDGSFLKLFPTIAIVTNIDADHLDYYKYFNSLKEAFLTYINNIPFYGYSVLCTDDDVIRELLPRIERPYYTYGFNDADFTAHNIRMENGKTCFKCNYKGNPVGDFILSQLGNHNVLNSLSVIAVSLEIGLKYEAIRDGLKNFEGVGRRLERIGEKNDILVMDDYGHHPTEIRATLSALKNLGRRIVVIFQPHRYSRTKLLWDEFGRSFGHADEIFLTAIYSAGEEPIEGITTELIRQSVLKNGNRDAVLIDRFEDIADSVIKVLQAGDVVITLGAGDIYKIGPAILGRIK